MLLTSRFENVGDDGRAALTALAIAGRELDERLLTSVTGLAGTRLRVAVRELADARLIDRPGLDDRYRLRHALVGEAILADMLVGDRKERHAAVARALTVDAAADGSGAVAEHWSSAGDATEEMPWRLAAATQAERVYAHREAARHWQRLIDVWHQVSPDARPAHLDLPTAYLNALAALDRCGDHERPHSGRGGHPHTGRDGGPAHTGPPLRAGGHLSLARRRAGRPRAARDRAATARRSAART